MKTKAKKKAVKPTAAMIQENLDAHELDAARSAALYWRFQLRPSVLFEPDVWRTSNDNCEPGNWVAEYKGVYATGETPMDAYRAFDEVWTGGKATTGKYIAMIMGYNRD